METAIIEDFLSGAHNRTRTGDLILTKNVLYLLSYVGSQWAGQDSNLRRLSPAGLQPAPFAARDTDPGGTLPFYQRGPAFANLAW